MSGIPQDYFPRGMLKDATIYSTPTEIQTDDPISGWNYLTAEIGNVENEFSEMNFRK